MASRLGIGAGIGIPFRNIASGGGKPYFSPEVKEALKAVVIAYGKTNNDSDRAVVKNLVDASNPFIISNAAYKLNSGYGKYEVDFTTWSKRNVVTSNNDNSFSFESKVSSSLLYYSTTIGVDTPSFKIKANISNCLVYYYYINDKGTLSSISILESGEFELPISHNTLYNGNIGIGFEIGRINGTGTGTITQIPSYQGAFVTDGVDDLITSTKTVQEMLGGSNEITIVSMVHQVKDTTNNVSFTNYIRGSINGYFRNIVNNYGKTGIYGYTSSDLRSLSVINNILGDKNDYTSNGDNRDTIINGNFSVQGYSYNNSNNTGDFSSVAWYWTVIANKVLTTDQINQVIAYYNLDRCVEPTVLYDVKRQGLSNDTPDSDWYLKDFSKNGFDMSLFNFAKKGNSGVGKYEENFLQNWWTHSGVLERNWLRVKYKGNVGYVCYKDIYRDPENTVIPSFKVSIKGAKVFYGYINSDGVFTRILLDEGIQTVPQSFVGTGGWVGFLGATDFTNPDEIITITQIPSHAGALCFDGVEDYGKVTGLPIYKDYTVVADYVRTFAKENVQDAPILSKSQVAGDGAFLFNYLNVNSAISSYSFGTNNVLTNVSDSERKIYYQSKYVNGGKSINSGTGTDYDSMWLGTYRDDSQFFFTGAIYSLMTFPYSMSEFLIERQLKKHKLGTLYPDMVEWRPIYTSNVNDYTITKATYFGEAGQRDLALGNHYPIGARFRIYVKPSGAVDEVTSIKVNGVELTYDYIDSNYGYAFNGTLSSKSPQKIDIAIDEYIRYEDIVQPYPAFYEFKDEDRNLVTWGGKVKVGTTITRIKAFADSNLLKDLYTISYPKLNGIPLSSSKCVVERQMVFTCTATWIFDDNEPNCILSPRLLRIPNSSYKILRRIPDISGHGNHGVIYNSAYAEGSGVNEDGSYQFDGVDDFVIIPTLSKSGKQVLMKINWNTEYYNRFIVDFRKVEGDTNYIINDFNALSNSLAYQNANKTYIDGILNNSIKTLELKGVTHNIVSQFIKANSSPYIGARTGNGDNMTMSLYDFMLFDEIDSDEEILTLNEYVGIEGNTDDLFN